MAEGASLSASESPGRCAPGRTLRSGVRDIAKECKVLSGSPS